MRKEGSRWRMISLKERCRFSSRISQVRRKKSSLKKGEEWRKRGRGMLGETSLSQVLITLLLMEQVQLPNIRSLKNLKQRSLRNKEVTDNHSLHQHCSWKIRALNKTEEKICSDPEPQQIMFHRSFNINRNRTIIISSLAFHLEYLLLLHPMVVTQLSISNILIQVKWLTKVRTTTKAF